MSLITRTANCGTVADWAKEKGLWLPYTATPQPGDLVIFDFSGGHTKRDHIGTLKAVTGSTLTTIEGNTSVTSNDNGGAVMTRVRYLSQVTGFIRPPWTDEQTARRFLEIAASQVGVTEYPSGSNKVKYNTWYYGREVSGAWYPWCMVFMAWCFAVLAGEITADIRTTTIQEVTIMVSAKQLRKGSTGSAVKKLQILLNGLGHACGTVDGDFGTKTDGAVRAFQKAEKLAVDGVVGANTWGRLIG